jgi:hypothetical protein
MKKIAYTIALMLVLVGSAFAQRVQTNLTAQSDPGFAAEPSFSESLTGMEITSGFADLEDNVLWGNTLTMRGDTSDLTASINRDGVTPNIQYGNKVLGGTWTLTVYRGGEFRGMLFGEFTSGSILWKTNRAGNIISEDIAAELLIKGGTGIYANVGGAHTFGKFWSTSDLNPATSTTDPVTSALPVHNGGISLMF